MTTPLKGLGYADRITPAANGIPEINGWARLQSLDLDWWYNWNQVRFDGTGSGFVPMLYSDNPTRLATLKADIVTANMPSAVLGFNEPDHEGQATMTTGQARVAWRDLEAAAAPEGLRIGSPATVSPDAWWMNRFMIDSTELESPDLKIDFVACHIYQNPSVSTFLAKIDALHDRWGKPVWVTETAVADFTAPAGIGTAKSARYTRTEVNDYMEDLWVELKKRPWLERFAWKTRNVNDNQMWFSALFNNDGSLTGTGQKYRDLA